MLSRGGKIGYGMTKQIVEECEDDADTRLPTADGFATACGQCVGQQIAIKSLRASIR